MHSLSAHLGRLCIAAAGFRYNATCCGRDVYRGGCTTRRAELITCSYIITSFSGIEFCIQAVYSAFKRYV